MKINTYAVNCNDAWLNSEGHDISGSYVKYKDHQEVVAALEAKCAALAAEVYDLKHPGTYLPSERETPGTDAFLAEVRASGVEMFAKKCSEKSKHAISSDTRDSWRLCGEHAGDFAAQLRKGVQS